MIEGRISAGVMIGANSDLGGGCSTMGTLSGGGTEVISVGENCLIGANAGIGIPLADGCIVEAGLYLTAGTKLNMLDSSGELQKSVKAKEIVGVTNLLFRRNSLSGAVECVPLKSSISLNEDLHSHN
jgi:2,3,4,5-tetrahydropyridine-2-carboxylate N-succinyltransferase